MARGKEARQKELKPQLYELTGKLLRSLASVPPGVIVTIAVGSVIATLWAHWTIVRRAGYPGCWSLILLVPCVNLLFLLAFAWSRWPIQGKKK